MSFFLHGLGDRQITELLADLHQLAHDRFKLPQGLNLLPVKRDQLRIGQSLGNRLGPFLSRQQRIRTAFDRGAIFAFDQQKLLGERSAPELRQSCKLPEQRLALVFQVWIIGVGLFYIVVSILQCLAQIPKKSRNPTFISSTPAWKFASN